MRRGARDFVQKPWENERLLVDRAHANRARRSDPQRTPARSRQPALQADGRSPILAESAAMRPVLEMIARVGPSDANVLDHRRERHRQEPGRAGPARRLASRRTADGHRQRRRHGRRRLRMRALRPPQGRLHRRQDGSRRPLRARRRRHAVPRRNRQRADDPASRSCCASSRPANSSGSAPRRPRKVRRPDHLARPTPTSTPKSRRRASGRTSISASTRSRFTSRRCAIAARTSRCWRALSAPARAALPQSR